MRPLWLAVILAASSAAIAQPFPHPMASGKAGMVVTCQPLAADVGVRILRAGGSAADAFIATTLAEYVTAYGYTSLSGPLNLLAYDAKSGATIYLNAGLNKVSDPTGQFDPAHPVAGQSFVIGGAGRGLQELHDRYGRLTFAADVTPAATLARQGFPLSKIYAFTIGSRAPIFPNATAWRAQFLPNGQVLAAGATLTQPALADTLTQYGAQGADYLFKGKFAQDLVATIQSQGGKLTLQDLAGYQANWVPPLQTTYRGFTVMSGSYRSIGGLELLLGLKAIENDATFDTDPRFSKDQATFNQVLRTFLFSAWTAFPHWTPFSNRLDDLPSMTAVLNGTSAKDTTPKAIWNEANDLTVPIPWTTIPGHDSCDTIVVDRDGNMVAGNHTINSLPWGDYGLMTDGVSLNSAYPVAGDAPPGVRAIDPLAPVMIFKDGKPWAEAGFFDGSLQAAAFEVLLNLMDYGMTASDAVFTPRFGTPSAYVPLTVPIDQRYPADWIATFAKSGITLAPPRTAAGAINPSGYVDTGDADVIRIDAATGLRTGSPTEILEESIAESE